MVVFFAFADFTGFANKTKVFHGSDSYTVMKKLKPKIEKGFMLFLAM